MAGVAELLEPFFLQLVKYKNFQFHLVCFIVSQQLLINYGDNNSSRPHSIFVLIQARTEASSIQV